MSVAEADSPLEGRVRVVVLVSLIASALVVGGSIVAAPFLHRPGAPAPPVLGQVPTFSLTDQANRTVTDGDLRGKVWVADFFFTRCTTICPLLTERVAGVERWAAAEHLDGKLAFVSFSVDPERDTPAVLAEYAAKHAADPARWHFLTGDAKAIERASVDGFRLALSRTPRANGAPAGDGPDGATVLHGMKLILVDGDGRIRGYYDASPDGLPHLEADARRLVEELGP